MSSQNSARRPAVRKITITDNLSGQRIDNFLVGMLKGVPKSHVYRILRRGEVRVNGRRIRPAYKLACGDEVRVPPVRVADRKHARPPDEIVQKVMSRLIYEDERIMVVNKPAGLPVHAGTGYDFGLVDVLNLAATPGDRVYLVHRLDRDTSGCLLVARDREAMRTLHRALREGRVDKNYRALLMGRWGRGSETVELPLAYHRIADGKRISSVDDDGKVAVSIFSPVREYRQATLMKVGIRTGRTHQIRAHAAALGHPVAGDRDYGQREFNYRMKQLGLKRLFLHASSITFPHPDDHRDMTLEPPLDEDLEIVLDRLESS